MSRKIDSLVRVQQINERCILVTFGADAISAINTINGIVVIDAGISSGLTKKYRKIIQDEFQSADFAWVINTHSHHDHIRGDVVFPEAMVLMHRDCPDEIAGQWKDPDRRMSYMYDLADEYGRQLDTLEPNTADWEESFTQMIRCRYSADDIRDGTPVRNPDTTFSDSLIIGMGDVTLEMIHFGKCHSAGDILVYAPELKILFTGDLMARYGVPSINDTTMADSIKWQRAVHWIEKRMENIDLAIGGHGQILAAEDIRTFNRKIAGE
jgi:glyoxylase-like metal-dependent hydrolase (beta-lactamase superfamily II)